MRTKPPSFNKLVLGEGKNQETYYFDEIWKADYDNVAEASAVIPSVISWLVYHKAEAIERHMRSKRLYDEAEAEAYFELRGGEFEAKGFAGKPTEEAMKKAVVLMPSVRGAAQNLEAAARWKDQLTGLLVAVQAKLDLIRTTEATKRRIQEPTPVRDEEVEGAG
jgi:hypothetical protein